MMRNGIYTNKSRTTPSPQRGEGRGEGGTINAYLHDTAFPPGETP
jgi:hypothetical protein